LEQQLLDI